MQHVFVVPAHVADILPEPASAHFETLRQEATNAHAVLLSTSDTLRGQRSDKADCEQRRHQLITDTWLKPNDPLVLVEDKKIERFAASIGSLQKARTSTRPTGNKSLV